MEAFADAINDVGITYDFEPSESPGTLASRVDNVFVGKLTGEFDHDAAANEAGMSWIAFEAVVERVVQGDVVTGDRIFVGLEYNPASRDAADIADTAVVGLPVVVFADTKLDPPPRMLVGVEGLATACDEARPIGRVGSKPAWLEIRSLNQLAEAADAPRERVEVRLWHCGIATLTVDDRRWEVPNEEEPFDATNAPPSFDLRGTVERVAPDELRYTDDSGGVLRFVPDDGTEPPCQ